MYGMEKSDRDVVAMKAANKGPSAELPERRSLPKGNPQDPNTHHAQKWARVHQGIERIREFVKRNPKEVLTTLLHHINEDSLKAAYYALKRDAAPGVDGMTWEAYNADLDTRIADLCTRVHRGTFRATPSRRVNIPKPDGGTRPLGIAALEDKIVQYAIVKCILEPIFEMEFCGFSYGFRPGRSAHDALDALAYVIERRKVSYVVDADIRKFFDEVDQEWMIRFLRHRIGDERVIRIITKFLKAGVMEDGNLRASIEGTPQGAVISPILANIYLHYALDLWFKSERKSRKIGGESYIVRYADDFVVCFEHREEAERFLQDLRARLKKFGLRLHPDKTRLIEFGRYAERNRRARREGRPKTFDFLGFTHYCRTTRKGHFGLGRKPIAKRLARFLKRVGATLRKRMHQPVHQTGVWLGQVLSGWLNYYAVPWSMPSLQRCYQCLKWIWLCVLRRRSQRDQTTWEQLELLVERYWPKLKIRHDWPARRFTVTHGSATRGRSRIR